MRKPLLVVLAMPVLLALMVALATAVLETAWASRQISEWLSARWGREVTWSGPLHIDWSMTPTIEIRQFGIANPGWAAHDHLLRVDEARARLDLARLPAGVVAIEHLWLERPRLHLATSPTGGESWVFPDAGNDGEPLLKPRFGPIEITAGEVTYTAPGRDTSVALAVDSGKGQRLRAIGEGRFRGHPFSLTARGDPLRRVVRELREEATGRYGFSAEAAWNDHRLNIDGETSSLTALESFRTRLAIAGPDANELANLAGRATRAADYRLSARFSRQRERWSLTAIDGRLGDTEVAGELSWRTARAVPELGLDLEISELALKQTLPEFFADVGAEDTGKGEGDLAPAQRLERALRRMPSLRGNLALKVSRLDYAEARLRNFRVRLDMHPQRLKLNTLAFELGEGDVETTGTLDIGEQLPAGNVDIRLRQLPLAAALAPFGYEGAGHLDGRLAMTLKKRALALEQSKLRFRRQDRGTDIAISLASRKTGADAPGVRLDADGKVRNRDFVLSFKGGPLLDLDDPARPYTVSGTVKLEKTEISMDGTLTQPLRLAAVDVQLQAQGPDPAALWYISPFPLPHLPPYNVKSRLRLEDNVWHLRDLQGTVGDSDIAGEARFSRVAREKPRVRADLHSDLLDLDDLAPVIGAAPATGEGEASSRRQQALARRRQQDDDVLPQGELMRRRLQGIDLSLDYRADRFRARQVPFEDLVLTLDLERGILKARPLSLKFGEGDVDLNLTLDANETPARGEAGVQVTRVNLKELLAAFDRAGDTLGLIGGSGDFRFRGDSVASSLASLDGDMHLLMNDGQIDTLLVEAAGLDLGETLITRLAGSPDPVSIDCLYAGMSANAGVVEVSELLITTGDSNFKGGGSIDFGKERYEIIVEARPRDFSLLSISSPVRLHGDFREVNLDVVSDELLGRGALALLGAIAAPPAALLALVEPGTASKRSGCRNMFEGISEKQSGSPGH